MACLGGECKPGFDEVAERVKLRERARAAALCITGEGRLDAQTARGKVVAGVGKIAREVDTPAIALVGAVVLRDGESPGEIAASLGLADLIVISPAGAELGVAIRDTAENLRRAAAAHLRRSASG